jgi:hypothetical protein
MIQIEITLKDKLLLQQERYTQVHPRVMQKYNVLWLKANELE